jgi:hypothetical protein
MDRDRFRNRSRELRAFAERMAPLAKMPERATSADLQLAADLVVKGADSIDELVKARPSGCICRTIDRDDYSYLDYAEACLHHGGLFVRERDLKEGYAKMEKALKNEVRMKLVAAALSGAAVSIDPSLDPEQEEDLKADVETAVGRAIAIADETIRRITSDPAQDNR